MFHSTALPCAAWSMICITHALTSQPAHTLTFTQRLAAQPQAAAQHYFLPMPKWEERESSLLRRLHQAEGVDPDAVAGG
jgi:hypothetical protein